MLCQAELRSDLLTKMVIPEGVAPPTPSLDRLVLYLSELRDQFCFSIPPIQSVLNRATSGRDPDQQVPVLIAASRL